MSDYEIGLLGGAGLRERDVLAATLGPTLRDLGLRVGRDVSIRLGDEFRGRSMRSAGAAAYFGMADPVMDANTRRAVADGLPVIPVVPPTGGYDLVPEQLRSFNGLRLRAGDAGLEDLASALLDCLGLLRRQRRAFVSYRRIESRNAAVQIHDLLSGRGFDVFLDTHDIRPGEPFQEVLWNRLCDSDVMVMLDTPTYFASKWTRQEFGRARAKEIHVLRVVWPAHAPDPQTDFAETVHLDPADLVGGDGPISDGVADDIVRRVENLRSRSIASRHRSIASRLRAEVRRIGGEVEGFGAHRALAVRLPDGRRLWAYPVVGVPTAELLNDVEEKARRADRDGPPILVYDHVGVRGRWAAHLQWLGDNVKSVRAISIGEAAWTLAAWEDGR